tara:strand:+ start:642 stop:1067 length:426 start_codon:yes stop_codon:yes gene_type:complete
MWKKIKQLSSGVSNFLYDNRNSVYTASICTIIFAALLVNSEVKYTASYIKNQKENMVLAQELNIVSQLVIEQRKVIDLQETLMSQQKKYMLDANQGLKLQEDLIKKLIQYLKDLDEWPPQIDPDKITRSEAIHEEEIMYIR